MKLNDLGLTQQTALQLSQKDEEILKHQTDIECEELEPTEDEDGDELAGFRLTFHFSKNTNFDHEKLVGCLFLDIMDIGPARMSLHDVLRGALPTPCAIRIIS